MLGHDARHRQRVVDVALAARAELVAVGLGGHLVGVGDRRPPAPSGGASGRLASSGVSSAGVADSWCRRQGSTRSTVPTARPPYRSQRLDVVRRRGAARPPRSASSISTPMPTMSPPSVSTRRAVAAAVPPVASTSSMMSTRSPGWMASRWISSLSVPYSSCVLLAGHGPRQLAGLAHRDEGGADAIGDRRGEDEAAGLDADDPVDADAVEAADRARRWPGGTPSPLPSRGVMSRNVTPGCG